MTQRVLHGEKILTNVVKVDATIKISKGKKSLDLTLEETRELYLKLSDIVGEKLFVQVEGEKDG